MPLPVVRTTNLGVFGTYLTEYLPKLMSALQSGTTGSGERAQVAPQFREASNGPTARDNRWHSSRGIIFSPQPDHRASLPSQATMSSNDNGDYTPSLVTQARMPPGARSQSAPAPVSEGASPSSATSFAHPLALNTGAKKLSRHSDCLHYPVNHPSADSGGGGHMSPAKKISKSLSCMGRLDISPTKRLSHQVSSGSCVNDNSAPISVLSEIRQSSPKAPSIKAWSNSDGTDGNSQPTSQASTHHAARVSFYGPLGFQIPEAQLHQIEKAHQKDQIYWQYSLYRGPSGERVKIHYCKSKETSEDIAKLFLNEEVIGFDIEWKQAATQNHGIRKNVSLVQIASENRIALFHISRYAKGESLEDLVAPSLKTIMESPKITKVGVSIKGDCTRLRKFMGIDSRGLFELSYLYKLVKYAPDNPKFINKKPVRLAQQVEEHLQLPLYKGQVVRMSDWSKDLNYEQIRYAASDSYAGLQLFYMLEGKRNALCPVPPRPEHAELNSPIRLADDEIAATGEEPSQRDGNESFQDMKIVPVHRAAPSKKVRTKANKRAVRRPGPKSCPEITKAEDWIEKWRTKRPSTQRCLVISSQLRAYYLWHEQKFDISAVAALLRDPPLKQATVATYVLDAIRLERLSFEKDRIMPLIECLHSTSKPKYASFLKRNEVGNT